MEDVKCYMKGVLVTLCEQACKGYPALRRALKTSLVEDFMEAKGAKAKEVVGGIVKAELQYQFTQDRTNEETVQKVHTMVAKARERRNLSEAVFADSKTVFPSQPALGVEDIEQEFVEKMVNCKDPATSIDGEAFELQVIRFSAETHRYV